MAVSAMDQILTLIAQISAILAIIGFAFSLLQIKKNRETARALEVITKDSKTIAASLSTKFITEFPGYMAELASLISSAKRNIFITHVLQTKSIFTDYDAWLKYKQAVEQALSPGRHLKVSAVFSSEPRQREFLEAQFATEKQNWHGWRSKEVNRLRLKTFIQHFGDKDSGEYNDNNISFEQFMGIFARTNQMAKTELFRGADVFEIDFCPQIYSWIIDDGEAAIFVIPVLRPVFTAHAFWTTDPNFTNKVMIPLHEEHCRSGRKISPERGVN
jgi:hypothetical protein